MGGDRQAEKASTSNRQGENDALSEYRMDTKAAGTGLKETFNVCSTGDLKLNDLSLFSSKDVFPSKDGSIGVDSAGRLSVYKNCDPVFSYGPNGGDTFIWIPQNGQTVLSEIKHDDGRVHRFNSMSNEWLVFDPYGRLENRQTSHIASFSVKGITVDVPISGPVSVEKLRLEHDKFRAVISGNDLPFSSDEIESLARRFELREGLRLDAYKDSKQIWTIGIGLNLETSGAKETLQAVGADYDEIWRRKDSVNPVLLTQQQADQLLKLTMRKAVYECKQFYGNDSTDGKPLYDKMPKNVQKALVDLMFNMGPETLSKLITFNALIRNGSYSQAGEALMKTKYAKDVGPTRSGENRDLLARP